MRITRIQLLLGSLLLTAMVGSVAYTQPDMGRGPGGGRDRGPGGGRGPGGFGGGGPGGGGFRPNTDEMFKSLSGGADSVSVSSIQIPEFMTRFEPAEKQKERMTAFLQSKGVTNGVMTKALYAEYFEGRMREMRERFSKMREGGGGPSGRPGSDSGGPASPAPPGGGSDSNPADMEKQAREAFARLDTNGDGALDETELQAVRRFSRIYDERERYDTNKNGKIEFEEYLEYFKNRPSRSNRGRDGRDSDRGGPREEESTPKPPVEEDKRPTVYRAGKLPKDLPSWFEQVDTDKDGQVGLYEWKRQGRTTAEFLAIDANADGFITVEELLRFQKVAKKDSSNESNDNGSATASLNNGGRGRSMSNGGSSPRGRGGDGDTKDGKRDRFSRMRWGNRPPGR